MISVDKIMIKCYNDITDFDWIYLKNENINPIPLTKEWLLKFGFKHNTEYIFIHENFNAAHFKFKIKKYSNNDCLVLNCKTTVRYVHELQNIYFAIMRNELTLNI